MHLGPYGGGDKRRGKWDRSGEEMHEFDTASDSQMAIESAATASDVITVILEADIDDSDHQLETRCRLRRMFENGAPKLNLNDAGDNALHIACGLKRAGQIIKELLIRQGMDVNAVNKNGDSALMVAARNGSDSAIGELLEHKPKVTIKNEAGETVFTVGDRPDMTFSQRDMFFNLICDEVRVRKHVRSS